MRILAFGQNEEAVIRSTDQTYDAIMTFRMQSCSAVVIAIPCLATFCCFLDANRRMCMISRVWDRT